MRTNLGVNLVKPRVFAQGKLSGLRTLKVQVLVPDILIDLGLKPGDLKLADGNPISTYLVAWNGPCTV